MQVKMMQVLGRIRISGYIRNVSNFKRCFTKSFSTSPSQRVHQLIEAGTIKQDPKQDRVLELIDQLYVQIESYSPPSLPSKPCPNCASGTFNKPQQETKTQKRSLWNSFFGSSETKNSQIKPFYNSSHINIPHIYIYGGTGTGKTMLTDILYECLTTNSKQRVHFNKFMLELHDEIHRRTRESGKSADDVLPELSLNIAKKSQIFYIDEFQVDNLVDALLLNRLFTSLFYYGVIFFFTSNREPENLYLNGLQRTAAWEPFLKLFKSRCSIIDLNTINYRDGEDGFGYFIDNDPTSFSEGRLQFENAWAAICGIEESKTIQVMAGRKLICPRSSKNIATRFNFGELCETNKGSADYIALSKAFNTVFIENVPYFHFLNRNEMKRFIWLIDELYNGKNNIICLSADKPDNLLQIDKAKENIFEDVFQFERCKKRLIEMKSKCPIIPLQSYGNKV